MAQEAEKEDIRERLEEVAPDLYLVHALREGRIPYAHSVLLLGERNILVDTGLGPAPLEELRERFRPRLVLNSHYHRDHNCGNHLFKGVPMMAHEADAPALNSLRTYFRMMGVPGRKDAALVKKFTLSFIPHVQGPRVGPFRDGRVFDTGSVKVRAVHLPGHSPGHSGFLEPESGVLFSADICPDGFGPWYGHACSSIEDFMSSIGRILEIRPPVLLAAHAPPLRKGIPEALRSYRGKVAEREKRVLSLLKEPRTLEELLGLHPIYGRYPGALKLPFKFWEEVMVRKHLERLQARGRVRVDRGRYALGPC